MPFFALRDIGSTDASSMLVSLFLLITTGHGFNFTKLSCCLLSVLCTPVVDTGLGVCVDTGAVTDASDVVGARLQAGIATRVYGFEMMNEGFFNVSSVTSSSLLVTATGDIFGTVTLISLFSLSELLSHWSLATAGSNFGKATTLLFAEEDTSIVSLIAAFVTISEVCFNALLSKAMSVSMSVVSLNVAVDLRTWGAGDDDGNGDDGDGDGDGDSDDDDDDSDEDEVDGDDEAASILP